jgi:HEAT repeat protein
MRHTGPAGAPGQVPGVVERMPPRIRSRTLALVLALYAGGYALAIAQPEAASRPGATAAAAKNAAAPPAARPADEESPLLVEPKTPAEFFDAAVLTDRLYRPGLTKRYLQKLLQSNPSDEALLELRNKYGPGIFLHLSRDPALRPEATQLLDRVTAVLRKHDQDPAFLDSLIDGLQGNPGDRDTSIEMLRNIGPTVVPRILERLAAPKRGDEPGLFVQSLAQMGEQMVPVLCGALESTNDSLRGGAIQALGLIGSNRAVPYLLDPAFDHNQPKGIRAAARTALARILGVPTERGDGVSAFGAQTDLKKQAQLALANRMSWPTTEGKTDLWTWNDGSKTLDRHTAVPAVASLYAGLRFARQALSMAPEDRQAQVLFLALQFAWSARDSLEGGAAAVSSLPAGRDAPLDLALTAGPEVTSGTLALGEALGNPAVEIGAIHALAAVGAHEEIYGARRSRSPLLAALDNPNPEVQYAAAVAILRANPETPFRGARRVVEVLTRAISGPASPVAIVIDTNRVGGNDMAGFLSQLGFEPITATTGRQGFEMAVRQSNVVLIAVEANVIRWPLSQTVSNLRADARSAQVPILVYGPESVRSEIRGMLAHYPRIQYMVESATPQNVEMQAGSFLKQSLALAAPPANRAERVIDATSWLASIANGNRTRIFNLDGTESALMAISMDRSVYANALTALAAIPTGAVQRHFEQLAISERLDPAIREAAAGHLVAHIQRHGLLLSAGQVNELESAWRSAQSPEMATTLAAVVGSLKPNARRVSDRFQSAPTPAPAPGPAPQAP